MNKHLIIIFIINLKEIRMIIHFLIKLNLKFKILNNLIKLILNKQKLIDIMLNYFIIIFLIIYL